METPDQDIMSLIDITHIFTLTGCKISLNGQGYLPCGKHTLEHVLKVLDETHGTDTEGSPRA